MRKTKTLLGISLLGATLVLFGVILTKSGMTQAQSFTKTSVMYTGIDSEAETLYGLTFQGLTTMEINGSNVFRVSDVPVVINGINASNITEIDTSRNMVNGRNSNILGGDLIKIEGSDNITVIGGAGIEGEPSISPNNNNATFFGGHKNKIRDGRDEMNVPAVLLGGELNEVRPNHTAAVIVGGITNQIHDNAKNVSILGGENVVVLGDRSNVIAGGVNVRVHGVDNVFVFSDDMGTEFTPAMSGAFYLNVQNGVGFGTGADGNGGVTSRGAVSLGYVNIEEIECNGDNIGLQGSWNGCLVGCTENSATNIDWHPWELLDHGSQCADVCSSNHHCIQADVEEKEIESYTSFCTEGLVFTGNSTLCPDEGEGLDKYQNVVFETNLIDSEATCPTGQYNKCVYQCNSDTHLTGDVTGKFVKNNTGITMCFHDCRLPWDDEGTLPRKKHNETITGYNVSDAYCSNDAGTPKDHCGNHKHELICVDGTWYTTNSNHKANAVNTTYLYETCTLNRYEGCDGTGYNLTRREIINVKEDFMPFWRYGGGNQHFIDYLGHLNDPIYIDYQYDPHLYDQFNGWVWDDPRQTDRSEQRGVRGIYHLCIDYVPNTETGDPTNVAPDNETTCREKDPLPYQYHYKFLRCREGYTLDPKDEVCRKNCSFGTKNVEHGGSISLYTGTDATCTDICHVETFKCYDGTLYQASTLQVGGNGKLIHGIPHQDTSMSIYNQINCTLHEEVCTSYQASEAIYNQYSGAGLYNMCQTYSPSGLFACIPGVKKYDLQYCYANHYKNGQTCPTCPTDGGLSVNGGGYVSNTGATALNQCSITCSRKTYVAEPNGPCVECPIGTYPAGTVNYLQTVHGGEIGSCNSCTNKPSVGAHYTTNGSQANDCGWTCNPNRYLNDGSCPSCPTGYSSNTGSTALSQCRINCAAGTHVATANAQCEACPTGTYSLGGNVNGGNTSSCNSCTNGPANSTYTSNGTSNSCTWQCNAGYYKGTETQYLRVCPNNVNGTCVFNPNVGYICKEGDLSICSLEPVVVDVCLPCPEGKTSLSGATSENQCDWIAKCGSSSSEYRDEHPASVFQIPLGFTVTPTENLCDVGMLSDYPALSLGVVWTWSCSNSVSTVRCSAPYKSGCTQQGCGMANHGDSLTCYNSVECPDETSACQSATRSCNNGNWYNIKLQSDFPSGYTHSTCTRAGVNTCTSDYNLDTCPRKATCSSCQYYQGGNSCTTKYKKKITGCENGYHLYNNNTECKPDPQCGSANGQSYYSKPNSSLCAAGTPSDVTGNGPWYWTCTRYDYSVSCSASKSSSSNGDQGNQGTCFLAGTHVLTKDGYKNIEDILTGDLVLSYNTLANEYEYNKVLKKIVHENSIDDVYTLTIDGNKLDVTELHPFYVIGEAGWPYQCHLPYEWVSANRLRVGDKLLMSDGSYATIENITHRSNRSTTYNLNVENAHTYFVGEGYLVHNSDLTKDQQNRWESAGGNESRAWYANDCDLHPENCEGRIDRWTGVY